MDNSKSFTESNLLNPTEAHKEMSKVLKRQALKRKARKCQGSKRQVHRNVKD